MDMKDVGFFQKHVEKLVLGAAGLFLVGIGAWMVLGSPYAVELGRDSVGPRELEQRIRDRAQQLEGNLRDSRELEQTIAQRRVPAYAADFATRLQSPPLAATRLAALGAPGLEDFGELPEPEPYHVPQPPAPTGTLAIAGYGQLAEDLEPRSLRNALQRFVRNGETRDIRWVSVGAEFDTEQWQERLASAGPNGEQRVPEGWARRAGSITAVYLERERFDRDSRTWVDRQRIDPLPEQIAFVPDPDAQWTERELSHLRDELRQQELIARPPFPPLAPGGLWIPPDGSRPQLTEEDHRDLQDLNARIEMMQSRVEHWDTRVARQVDRDGRADPRDEAQLREFVANLQDLERDRNERLGLDEDILSPEPPQRRAERRAPRQQTRPDPYELDAAMLRERQRMYEQEMQMYEQEVPFEQPAQQRQRRPVAPEPEEEEEEEPGTVRVWAHDLTVEPGQVYRYRVVVSLYNPLFQERRLSEEQRQRYGERVGLTPDERELAEAWSEPVEIDPEHRFFLVDAAPEQPRAELELWRLYAGMWHSHSFEHEPGDVIGGQASVELVDDQQLDIDMTSPYVLVDVVADDGAPAAGRRATRAHYLHTDADQVATRSLEQDVESIDRIRLSNEASLRRQLLRSVEH